ncbi:hypothetical protein BR93DRAFT_469390 [Coniochaeta sp. PMI_546]|nr:hypothetical protein BR93DRAFT_469390 [Coniochaeta sp. PMI_546]
MERDIRRDRGQWRGCHSFKDIVCDGEDGYSPSRDGGLKMGQTYYYYYELDGSTETHDPSVPTTNHCPYLPGQTVNTLWVPMEQSSRKRSASLTSVRAADLKTMNPRDRFTSPRPAPSPSGHVAVRHTATAPTSVIRHKRSARSLSPGSSWSFSPRKLFSRKASSSSLRESDTSSLYATQSHMSSEDVTGGRPPSREGSRSRDISPDSLRRFLSDDTPLVAEPEVTERPTLAIPEDIAEENEDDDNFATSATSESLHFTVLSPPPSQHSQSRCTTPMPCAEDASQATVSEPAVVESIVPEPPTRAPPSIPDFAQIKLPAPSSNTFFLDSPLLTPASPESTASNEIPSFYYSDDEGEEEDDGYQLPSLGLGIGGTDSFNVRFGKTLSTYSLPLASEPTDKLAAEEPATAQLGSPALVARNGTDVPVGNTSLLASPIPNSGLDELVNELGWMADLINGKAA